MPNKLNHKPQAMQGVCKENKEKQLEEKNDCPLKYFAVKGGRPQNNSEDKNSTDFRYNNCTP